MASNLTERYQRGREVFQNLSPARKIGSLGVIAMVLAGFVLLLVWTNRTEYGPLYANLVQDDAGAIIGKLKERKTPYRLTRDGTTIEIPREMLQETRLWLATEGLPAGGGIGMELFDQQSFGATDFVQRLNYQRALQGELERTIQKFPQVDQVRIHLNIPKESLFIEEAREPSASVMLKLYPGRELSRSQLAGVVHLISSSVEGLKAENVSVVDASGGLLYSRDEMENGSLSENQLQQRRKLEQDITARVTTMLERVVGPEAAITRVTAELNHQQVHSSEEIFDPDRTAVRSEQRLNEKSEGPGRGAGGVPTATFELGTGTNQQGQGAGQNEVYQKTEDTTNYEVTKINRQIMIPPGELKRLSIAVMVDGTYNETVQDGQNGEHLRAPSPDPNWLSWRNSFARRSGSMKTVGTPWW